MAPLAAQVLELNESALRYKYNILRKSATCSAHERTITSALWILHTADSLMWRFERSCYQLTTAAPLRTRAAYRP